MTALERVLTLGQSKSLKVPPELHKLEYPPKIPAWENPSFSQGVTEDIYTPDPTSKEKASTKDLAYILARMYAYESDAVPAWTGFNKVTSPDDSKRCSVGYLPLINAPAHECSTLWTGLMRCLRISHMINLGQYTVITLDQQLYCKAKKLQWANPDKCKSIFVRLGGFILQKTSCVSLEITLQSLAF